MDRTSFRGHQVHQSVWLAQGAVLVGDVTVGQDSSIWFNAVLRGDTEAIVIGRRTNIQDGCILHADPGFPCTIGDGVTVGHGAIVHGARVADNVTVGMGSVLMNGVRVGENSIIGVGAVVTEGIEIPPGSLVLGLPGKVRREVTAAEIERNRQSAEHYVQAARMFRASAGGK